MILSDESEVNTFHQVSRDPVKSTGTDPCMLAQKVLLVQQITGAKWEGCGRSFFLRLGRSFFLF